MRSARLSGAQGEEALEKVLLQAVLTQYKMDPAAAHAPLAGRPSPSGGAGSFAATPSPGTTSRHGGASVSRSLRMAVQWARVDVMESVIAELLAQSGRGSW